MASLKISKGTKADTSMPIEKREAAPETVAPVVLNDAEAAEEARHQRVMASAERVARKHRNVFAALAK